MSAENHPNVNAVGLVTAAFDSIEKYKRGVAGKPENKDKVFAVCSPFIQDFANNVSDALDSVFGVAP